MTVSLVYGDDAVGKTMHVRTFCELAEHACFISMELKNRKVFALDRGGHKTEDSPSYDIYEALVIDPAPPYRIKPVETYNLFVKTVEDILKSGKRYDVLVVDGISDISKLAESVVLAYLQKENPKRKAIGDKDQASWSKRNDLANLPIEALSNWSVLESNDVFMTTLRKDNYEDNVKIGRKVSVQSLVKEKLCDVRVHLKCGRNGYTAEFEKVPDWSKKFEQEVTIAPGGLYAEYSKRGLV